MTTIMLVGSSDSREARRCDAKCHAAKKPACDCVCGGRYHGCGNSKVAQEHLQKDSEQGIWGEDMMKAIEAAKQEVEERRRFTDPDTARLAQQYLFPIGEK